MGLAKHSETLEEMVIYETRYQNDYGRTWVRPKQMFFESVEIDGKTTPRFKKIPLHIETKTSITESEINAIKPLIEHTFGEWDLSRFQSKLSQKKKFHLLIASIENQPVGFKIGFERDQSEFYSWLGGVHFDYRGLGIAQDLMTQQHDWCKKQGYTKISTKTQNCYKAMLILNVKNGFEIVGTEMKENKKLKILMEKNLA